VTIRISMWSGPRNISTTMMRAFESRPDTAVVDEPFYACYLKASRADHPYRAETLAAAPSDWSDVRAEMLGPLPAGKSVLFAKHVAYHYPDTEPLDWLRRHRSFILIRDPRAMIASYAKKYGEIEPIVESYRVCRRIHDFCTAQDIACPVVDAADILADPPGMLGALCAALGVPYTERMLSWPAGPRATDGPWGPHWYDAVNASTGFKPAAAAPALDPDLARLAERAMPDYEFFRRERLASITASAGESRDPE
jgi:hypothetical protein